MDQRYIQRFRLPPRQYIAGSPVVLAAGALLEDTKIPRLVAQLKFQSLSAKPITSLTVSLRCLNRDGMDVGGVEFCYENLTVQRGQTFGQHTAIVLPLEGIYSFAVTLSAVTFEGEGAWTAPVAAVWVTLPDFAPLEGTLADPYLLDLSRKGLPKGKYTYDTPADLWYCTCGGVNHSAEIACHRCNAKRSLVARYAHAGELAALPHEESRREAGRTAQAAPENAEAAEKAAQLKKLLAKKSFAKGLGAKRPRWGRRNALIAAAAGLVVVAGLVIFLPRLITDSSPAQRSHPTPTAALTQTSAPVQSPAPAQTAHPDETGLPAADIFHVTSPNDRESVYIDLEEDQNRICTLTLDMVKEQFPQVKSFELQGCPRMGNDIDPYLLDSFQMAFLVGTHGEEGGDEFQGSFSAKNAPSSTRRLLLFDSTTHLFGYAIGAPEEMGNGVWRLHVTLCDYDFSSLMWEQIRTYYASEQVPYIPPADIDSCGATWFLSAYNFRKNNTTLGNCQMYHLLGQLNSPYLEFFCRDMEDFEDRAPKGNADDPRFMYYVLLDENHAPIGYTMLNSLGSTILPAI